MRSAFAAYDASKMKDLVTKADLQIEFEKIRAEIAGVYSEVNSTRMGLRAEMKAMELRPLNRMIGLFGTMCATLIAIMAKGFAWVGF